MDRKTLTRSGRVVSSTLCLIYPTETCSSGARGEDGAWRKQKQQLELLLFTRLPGQKSGELLRLDYYEGQMDAKTSKTIDDPYVGRVSSP